MIFAGSGALLFLAELLDGSPVRPVVFGRQEQLRE